jgi:hypothetical protein
MNECFIIEFVKPGQVVPPRELLHRLGLATLEILPGRLVLINLGQLADPHWALRARELTRRLGQGVAAVRLETPAEKRRRHARREAGGLQCEKPVPRQPAPRR